MLVPASYPVQASPGSLARELDEPLSRRHNDAGAVDGDNSSSTISAISRLGARDADSIISSTFLSSDSPTPNDNAQRITTTSLHFLTLPHATTCERYSFSWFYDGPVPNANLTFSIVQGPLRRNYPKKGSLHLVPARVLTANISTSVTNFTWGSVDLMQGLHLLEGKIDIQGAKFLPHVSPLYVVNGKNTSCIKYIKPDTYDRPSLNRGDIAGIIVGAIAAAGLLAVAFIFPRLWRKDLPSLKKRRPYYLY